MLFFNRDKDYWKELADDSEETRKDADMIQDMHFKEFKNGGESVAEYASNIYLYWDLWGDYLHLDTFLKYGWLDVDRPVMNETLYRMVQTYSTILLVSFLLVCLGFFNLCIVYLIFVIAWPSYDEEHDHDYHKSEIVDPAIDLYINIRSQWRAYEKKIRHMRNFTGFKGLSGEWKVYFMLWKTPYDFFYLDSLPQLQAWKILSTQSLLRTDKVHKRRLSKAKRRTKNFLSFYSLGVTSAVIAARKKKQCYLFATNEDLPEILAIYFICVIRKSGEKYILIDNGQLALNHKAFDYELDELDIYVRYWYYFKTEAPFKSKKDFYLL